MPLALTTYSVVMAVHVMAVLAAYGLPLSAPLLLPYVRRNHPRAMPGLHDVQHRMNIRVTGPGTVLILLFGAYMASKHHLWGKAWVDVPIAIIATIAVVGGYVVQATRRMAELSRADVEAAGPAGAVTWSAAYDAQYRRYLAVEVFLGVIVLVAIFFMAAKPFS
jgi:uncharacterized membrane protein